MESAAEKTGQQQVALVGEPVNRYGIARCWSSWHTRFDQSVASAFGYFYPFLN